MKRNHASGLDGYFMTIKETCEFFGFSRSTCYREEKFNPDFPKLVKISPRRKAFTTQEVINYGEGLK